MPTEERRSFLKWAVHGMGALFTAILGIPAVAYLIDGRNRPTRTPGMRTVDGIKYSDLRVGEPKQGVLRNIRQDAWTLHPNDVIGRVWVLKKQDGQLDVFTTVCPHLGCSINTNADSRTGFTCPCHGAEFTLEGGLVVRAGYNNPAPRSMDSLRHQRIDDPANPTPSNRDLVQVEYLNFRQGEHTKIPKA